MKFFRLICTTLATLGWSHSFLDVVGKDGGTMRGAELPELDKQRLFCPYSNLTQCQPDPKHGVVLTAQNQRPCRSDLKSNPMATVRAGDLLYLHWAGNGHTASVGTCVKISISKFSMDPDVSSFTPLETCLPFARNGQDTDANVTIPGDLDDGEYTIFWLWDFAGFWFSSCADIVVGRSSGGLAAATSSTEEAAYVAGGCSSASVGKDFCKIKFGLRSYCQEWARDSCGRSLCHSDNSLQDCTSTSPSPRTQQTSTTVQPERASYASGGCTSTEWCKQEFGLLSYCRFWAKDHCNRSRCQGDTATLFSDSCELASSTTAPLTTHVDPSNYKANGCSSLPNEACRELFGSTSYCKIWGKDMCGRSLCFGPLSLTGLSPLNKC